MFLWFQMYSAPSGPTTRAVGLVSPDTTSLRVPARYCMHLSAVRSTNGTRVSGALEKGPGNVRVHYQRGQTLVAMRRLDDDERRWVTSREHSLKRALRLSPFAPDTPVTPR